MQPQVLNTRARVEAQCQATEIVSWLLTRIAVLSRKPQQDITLLGPLLGALHFLCNQIFGGRGTRLLKKKKATAGHPSGRQNYPPQQARNTVVGRMAGFTAGLEGTPRTRLKIALRRIVCQAPENSSIGMCPSGGGVAVEMGRHPRLQKLANQQARHTTGAFRTTDQGALRTPPHGNRAGQPPASLGPPARQGTKHGNISR